MGFLDGYKRKHTIGSTKNLITTCHEKYGVPYDKEKDQENQESPAKKKTTASATVTASTVLEVEIQILRQNIVTVGKRDEFDTNADQIANLLRNCQKTVGMMGLMTNFRLD